MHKRIQLYCGPKYEIVKLIHVQKSRQIAFHGRHEVMKVVRERTISLCCVYFFAILFYLAGGAGIMGVVLQLRLLLWKNFIVRRRNKVMFYK